MLDVVEATTVVVQKEEHLEQQNSSAELTMVDPAVEHGPSLRDLTRALRQNFRDTGVMDEVTARLRGQFVCRLRRDGLGVQGAQQATAGRNPNAISLRERVFHSLVVDYLATNGLLQSLSVFLPESGLGTATVASAIAGKTDGNQARAWNKGTQSADQHNGQGITLSTAKNCAGLTQGALSREDVLRGLPIPIDSALFRRVLIRAERKSTGQSSIFSAPAEETWQRAEGLESAKRRREEVQVQGLLEALVAEVAERSRAVSIDSSVQTEEPGRSHKENLVSRLETVRETWLRRAADERKAPAQDVTERMLAYQRECESRAAAQVKAEVGSFRERDLTALRVEMAANQRRHVEAMRRELQSQYDARVERLQETERERERRHAVRLRDVEASQFEARQNLLRDMDCLRSREQEGKRGVELEARAVRAEELRLRDLAASLESRAEELRRREREGARGREDLLEAARHEARQALEIKEENVVREREFLRQEMDAVRSERKACQEQLAQHAETATALQESRSEALSLDARARAAEVEAERWEEEANVYKEAYERRREVAIAGDRHYVQLGRAELEEKLRSVEAALKQERSQHSEALRKVSLRSDALAAEMTELRSRELKWEAEVMELGRALAYTELERDRAEHQAEEGTCEKAALESEVSELRLLLRRSRDAIEAIRLCDGAEATIAPASSTTLAIDRSRSPIVEPLVRGPGFSYIMDSTSRLNPVSPNANATQLSARARSGAEVLDSAAEAEAEMVDVREATSRAGALSSSPLRPSPANTRGNNAQFTGVDGAWKVKGSMVLPRHSRALDGDTKDSSLRDAWLPADGSVQASPSFDLRLGNGACDRGQVWMQGDTEWRSRHRNEVPTLTEDLCMRWAPATSCDRVFKGSRRQARALDAGYWSDGQASAALSRVYCAENGGIVANSRATPTCNSRRRISGEAPCTRNMHGGAEGLRGSIEDSTRLYHRNHGHEFSRTRRWAEVVDESSDERDRDDGDSGGETLRQGRGAWMTNAGERGRRSARRECSARQRRKQRSADGYGASRARHNDAAANHRRYRERVTDRELVARERAEQAERLLLEERERLTKELEDQRERTRYEQEARQRERQEERMRREEDEVEAMRRRLEAEEEAATIASAAARNATDIAAEERRRALRLGIGQPMWRDKHSIAVVASEQGTVNLKGVSGSSVWCAGGDVMRHPSEVGRDAGITRRKVLNSRGDVEVVNVATAVETRQVHTHRDDLHSLDAESNRQQAEKLNAPIWKTSREGCEGSLAEALENDIDPTNSAVDTSIARVRTESLKSVSPTSPERRSAQRGIPRQESTCYSTAGGRDVLSATGDRAEMKLASLNGVRLPRFATEHPAEALTSQAEPDGHEVAAVPQSVPRLPDDQGRDGDVSDMTPADRTESDATTLVTEATLPGAKDDAGPDCISSIVLAGTGEEEDTSKRSPALPDGWDQLNGDKMDDVDGESKQPEPEHEVEQGPEQEPEPESEHESESEQELEEEPGEEQEGEHNPEEAEISNKAGVLTHKDEADREVLEYRERIRQRRQQQLNKASPRGGALLPGTALSGEEGIGTEISPVGSKMPERSSRAGENDSVSEGLSEKSASISNNVEIIGVGGCGGSGSSLGSDGGLLLEETAEKQRGFSGHASDAGHGKSDSGDTDGAGVGASSGVDSSQGVSVPGGGSEDDWF